MKKKKEEISNFTTKLDIIDNYCRQRANFDIMLNRFKSSEGQLDQLILYAAICKKQRKIGTKLRSNKEICNKKLDYSKEFNK